MLKLTQRFRGLGRFFGARAAPETPETAPREPSREISKRFYRYGSPIPGHQSELYEGVVVLGIDKQRGCEEIVQARADSDFPFLPQFSKRCCYGAEPGKFHMQFCIRRGAAVREDYKIFEPGKWSNLSLPLAYPTGPCVELHSFAFDD